MFPRSHAWIAVAGAFTVFQALNASAAPVTNLVDLGYIAVDSYGDTYSAAVAINDSGQVAGISTDANGRERAVLLDHGVVTNIGVVNNGYESFATDINNDGDVVGTSDTSGGGTRAFLYSGGVLTDLGVLPGGYSSEGVGINNAGQIVGNSATADSSAHAFIYADGVMTDLGVFPGGEGSRPTKITENGKVTGYADTPTETHAFLYNGSGSIVDLGTLGGSQSLGFGINEAGDVVGSSRITGDNETHAFLYHAGVMTDLGVLPGDEYSIATVINEAGDVIAGYSGTFGDYSPFVYADGVMTDIGTPGSVQVGIVDINDDGEVLGYEMDGVNYRSHCFIYSNGVKTDLGNLGAEGCFPADWNSAGMIAGSARTSANDDHAFVTSCRPLPATNCDTAPKMSLQVKDNADDTRNSLKWKWNGGTTVTQADLGDPVEDDAYRLCIYDSISNADNLVAALRIEAGGNWVTKDPKGFQFKDVSGEDDGVSKVQLKTGEGGKSKAQLDAKGTALPIPTRFSPTAYFNPDSHVTVQLARDGGTQCWSSEFDSVTATKNDGSSYSAKAP